MTVMLGVALTLTTLTAGAQRATAQPSDAQHRAPRRSDTERAEQATELPFRLPPGTRRVDGRYQLSRGLAETTRWLEQRLTKTGQPFERLGPYRVRGIEVVRFLNTAPQGTWVAIHVSRKEGRTFLDVVARPPLTNPSSSR